MWRVKSGVWRVELKALGCLPCKEGDRRAVEGFSSEELGMMYISNC